MVCRQAMPCPMSMPNIFYGCEWTAVGRKRGGGSFGLFSCLILSALCSHPLEWKVQRRAVLHSCSILIVLNQGSQRDDVHLGWPIASKGGGRGSIAGSQPMSKYSCARRDLWRSNSIFNLWAEYLILFSKRACCVPSTASTPCSRASSTAPSTWQSWPRYNKGTVSQDRGRIQRNTCHLGSSIFSNCGSGSRVWWPKNEKKLQLEIQLSFSWSKIAIYLSLGLHKGRPSYRRSLQPSKENIQHFKTWKLCIFFYFYGSFLPSWIRIRNLNADPDPATQINADPDPKPCHLMSTQESTSTHLLIGNSML